jgi:hypothetical protein
MLGGGLFSRYFLDAGIKTMPGWHSLADIDVANFAKAARVDLDTFHKADSPNEAVTEERLIFPVLRLLGWDLLPQQAVTRRREDVPDALLYADPSAARAAMRVRVGSERYRLATVVHESKRWDLALDRATDSNGRTPASQALRYLRLAEELSGGQVRWAMLSNGRLWRLYAYDVTSQAERFLEADLAAMLEPGGEQALRTFILLFRRESFLPASDGRSMLQASMDEAREWQQAVTARLSGAVFEDVFPELLRALSAADPNRAPGDSAWPSMIRDSALILLYRLLFLLYAEDRDLLPVNHDGYRPFAITTLRREVADAIAHRRVMSETSSTWWPRLLRLFSAISGGNDAMGLPPYNGGLFDSRRAALLIRTSLPDAVFGRVLYRLSTILTDGQHVWINYRDLSVQQLGAIYEGLLERGVKVDNEIVVPVEDATLRHGSGAYYTPETLVRLVMRQAVAPLLLDRRETFITELARVTPDRRPASEKREDLSRFDPASAFLALKVCDPAMGSGHFLVSLVDWISDETLSAMEEAADAAAAFDYRSPLAERIASERSQIEAAASLHGWPLDPRQLDDRQMVRRLVLKRVVYGVDLNPLAVELAKLSLWLHSFTVGAPLSYLDHHLRCGNSLFGAWISDTDNLTAGAGRARRGGLALAAPIAAARSAAQAMEQIEDLSDADIAQVRQSAGLFGDIEEATGPLRSFLDCLHAQLWLPRTNGKQARSERESAVSAWLDGLCGDPVALANGAPPRGAVPAIRRTVDELLRLLRAIARERRFLHWQPAFPGVWRTWQGMELEGGFDAIIGNPPYVRQEHLGAIKPALKARFAAYDGVADLYVYFFEQALRLLRPGGRFAFTVTNKWLKAGYAEELRGVLAERAWLTAVTDFGHARGFFPGTDVFPSIVCAQRPVPGGEAPEDVTVTVVPRDLVRMEDLESQVAAGKFAVIRSALNREPWVLEPTDVRALMAKLRVAGPTLRDHIGQNVSFRGVLTGFNEAFVIDTPTRDFLVSSDNGSLDIIRPLLRGQDIDRWASEWDGLWLIFTRRGTNIDDYPAIRAHLEKFRNRLEPQPSDWHGSSWTGRKAGKYEWFEIQDNTAYYKLFDQPKIIYQEIQYYPSYSLETKGQYLNNKGFMIPSSDPWLLAILNSPLMWWFGWRHFARMKDEALTPQGYRIELLPIASSDPKGAQIAANSVAFLHTVEQERQATRQVLRDWLRVAWDLPSPPAALLNPFNLSADAFATSLRAALPASRRTLSAAAVGAIRSEHSATIAPMIGRLAEAARHEVALSHEVNRAYGLTREDELLLWSTAPPRMPIVRPADLPSTEHHLPGAKPDPSG